MELVKEIRQDFNRLIRELDSARTTETVKQMFVFKRMEYPTWVPAPNDWLVDNNVNFDAVINKLTEENRFTAFRTFDRGVVKGVDCYNGCKLVDTLMVSVR